MSEIKFLTNPTIMQILILQQKILEVQVEIMKVMVHSTTVYKRPEEDIIERELRRK